MAFVVSNTLSMALSAAKFPVKELPLRKAPLAILSCQPTVRTATNLLAHCCSNRDIFSVRNRCGYLILIDHSGEPFYCCKNISSCTRRTIIGYWVGPDIDDGWGYVEAFVNPST